MFYSHFVNCNVISGSVDVFYTIRACTLLSILKNCFDTNGFVFTQEDYIKLRFVFFLGYTNFRNEGNRVKV